VPIRAVLSERALALGEEPQHGRSTSRAGGHGRVVLDILRQKKEFNPVGFLDNNPAIHGRRVDGLPVLGGMDRLDDLKARGVRSAVIASATTASAARWPTSSIAPASTSSTPVHPPPSSPPTSPSAKVSSSPPVRWLRPLPDRRLLCSQHRCIIDHESMIGTAAHICPGVRLAGHVTVESGAFIGIGATVIQNIRVGFEAVVGAVPSSPRTWTP